MLQKKTDVWWCWTRRRTCVNLVTTTLTRRPVCSTEDVTDVNRHRCATVRWVSIIHCVVLLPVVGATSSKSLSFSWNVSNDSRMFPTSFSKSNRGAIWEDYSSSKYASSPYDVILSRWRPWRHCIYALRPLLAAALFSSVCRLPAKSPSACDVNSWSIILSYLLLSIHPSMFICWCDIAITTQCKRCSRSTRLKHLR